MKERCARFGLRVGASLAETHRDGLDSHDPSVGDWTLVSPRERAILELVIGGLVAKEIAVNRGIPRRMVETYLENLQKKFNAKRPSGSSHTLEQGEKVVGPLGLEPRTKGL